MLRRLGVRRRHTIKDTTGVNQEEVVAWEGNGVA